MTSRAPRLALLAALPLMPGCERIEPETTPPQTAPRAAAQAADTVVFETTKGSFTVAVRSDWAPHGAERFLHLVRTGYYDDARFHRVVPDFIAQWGLAGDPALTAEWLNAAIPDDSVRASNTRGRVAFAFTDPGTRTTQVYINLVDNVRLDSAGFAPIGNVVEGMEVVDALYSGYGESSGGGLRRGDQSRIVAGGNLYLDREFPRLDRILRARVTSARGGTTGEPRSVSEPPPEEERP
ncbi:MAG: peptidylprolyl isomerase [Gemmatimonadota bacterium]|nr:peptidylprolyl isomerase [Gemmatimonadota bacterium]